MYANVYLSLLISIRWLSFSINARVFCRYLNNSRHWRCYWIVTKMRYKSARLNVFCQHVLLKLLAMIPHTQMHMSYAIKCIQRVWSSNLAFSCTCQNLIIRFDTVAHIFRPCLALAFTLFLSSGFMWRVFFPAIYGFFISLLIIYNVCSFLYPMYEWFVLRAIAQQNEIQNWII